MKAGDLVIRCVAATQTLRPDLGMGLVADDNIIRNRIGIIWCEDNGSVSYEPVKWLKVVSKIPRI